MFRCTALPTFHGNSAGSVGPFEKNAVAVVSVEGVIENSDDIVQTLDRLGKNDGVRAVVLRVDSPGGGVAPSQEIYDAVWRVRAKKPIVASLGGEAASGGYYIASACQTIVANPGTLTGSIGVIMQLAEIEGLLKKVGVRYEVIKAGKFKDSASFARPMTPEERALLQAVLDDMHDQFITAIAEGRHLRKEQVRALADGRVYSGRMAKDLGLVDALGGLDEAIRVASELGGVPGKPHLVRPRRGWRLLDLAGVAGGQTAAAWLRSLAWQGTGLPALPLLGSAKLPLYLLD